MLNRFRIAQEIAPPETAATSTDKPKSKKNPVKPTTKLEPNQVQTWPYTLVSVVDEIITICFVDARSIIPIDLYD